jgi:hypothetical protein
VTPIFSRRCQSRCQGTLIVASKTDRKPKLLNEAKNGRCLLDGTRYHMIPWSWEVLSLIFSNLCFVAVLATLLGYNGKPSSELPCGVTLNAIVSVLATGTKSSLIFVTSTAIGQLKWIWYRQRNRIYDMQIFDDASRGLLGSILIVLRHKMWSLVSLGAAITLLALAIDPFMQQLLSYP